MQKVNAKQGGKANNQSLTNAYKELEEAPQGPWIRKFMKNSNYNVQKVEGDGSCFFWCSTQHF